MSIQVHQQAVRTAPLVRQCCPPRAHIFHLQGCIEEDRAMWENNCSYGYTSKVRFDENALKNFLHWMFNFLLRMVPGVV